MVETKQALAVLEGDEALKAVLAERKGAEIFTFTAETEPKMLKKNRQTGEANPYKKVIKVSTVNAILNSHYENNVNAQRAREGKKADFEAKANWFKHIPNTPFVEHATKDNGETYLLIRSIKSLETTYFADGELVTKERLAGWLPKSGKPTNQGLTRPIIVRTFKLSGLRELKKTGKVFVVTNAETAEGDIVEREALITEAVTA